MEILTLPVNLCYSLKHPAFEGLLLPSFVLPRRQEGSPNIWEASGISGNVFAHPQASSSAPYPQELNSTRKKTSEEPIHMSTAEKSGRSERDQDLRCQSGPSVSSSGCPDLSSTNSDTGSGEMSLLGASSLSRTDISPTVD